MEIIPNLYVIQMLLKIRTVNKIFDGLPNIMIKSKTLLIYLSVIFLLYGNFNDCKAEFTKLTGLEWHKHNSSNRRADSSK